MRLRRLQHLQRTDDLAQQVGGDLRVDHRGVEFLVAEQRLDDADVDLLLEQVGREAVPPMPISALSPLFRVPDYAAPNQPRASDWPRRVGKLGIVLCFKSQSSVRKASSWSSGRNLPGVLSGGVVRAKACSLMARFASR